MEIVERKAGRIFVRRKDQEGGCRERIRSDSGQVRKNEIGTRVEEGLVERRNDHPNRRISSFAVRPQHETPIAY